MAMPAAEIEALIKAALPDAEVEIEALVDDGDHYLARVTSAAFAGKSRVQQHKLVYEALGGPDGRRAARLATGDRRSQLNRRRKSTVQVRQPCPIPTSASAKIVNDHDVVLFMKGTPLFPQCGFSSRAIAILDHCGVAYESVDVLQDMEIRQGIKAFSDWPTIPQLYVKGEFVGGSDIMMEMYQAGELQQLLDEKDVAKAE